MRIRTQRRDSFESLIAGIERKRLYRTREVAALLECSVRYVQLLVELGRLEALRLGRAIRVPGYGLVRYIRTYRAWED
jgi:excisionase family DNA binding protein